MEKHLLLGKLPAFNNKSVLIEKRQTVRHIIREVMEAHKIFASDYDAIAEDFYCSTPTITAQALFNFCKENIRYVVEPEEKQTTKSPAAIIALGDSVGGDCKHYAGFIGGVLDALNRRGCNIEWFYRFASYDMFDHMPQHVFIVVIDDEGKEIWVDPVLNSFNSRSAVPYHTPIDKKPNRMPLFRIAGVDEYSQIAEYPTEIILFEDDYDSMSAEDEEANLTPELQQAIELLMLNGVMNVEGQISDTVLMELSHTLPQEEFNKISDARALIQIEINNQAAIGSFFGGIWRGVKKVGLAVPRNAYLSLVALNVFGYATKLSNCLYNKDGSYDLKGKEKLNTLWSKKFAGSFSNLERAIKSGMKKKAILGTINSIGAAAAAAPAWLAAASAIIAAIAPIIAGILKTKSTEGTLSEGIDPATGLPYGMNDAGAYSGGGIMDWIKENPLIVVGGAVAAVVLFTGKKRS